MNDKPATLAFTVGDPLSIGPEILAKALADQTVMAGVRPLVLGPADMMQKEADKIGLKVRFQPIGRAEEARYLPGVIDTLELGHTGFLAKPLGVVDAQAGKASVEYVIEAAKIALAGQVDAIVTGPINKESVQAGGYKQYIGNTEILEDICGQATGKNFTGKCLTMLMSKKLRVAHVTRHIPFAAIPASLTPQKLEITIRQTFDGMVSLGLPNAHVALAGLNPHNGDNGLMGDEEGRILEPLVKKLAAEGLKLSGPVPADSVFFRAINGDFDAVVALYHDQGHIAVKTYGFEESISVSFGLPVIRTSVDHGTAFDIAGKGIALPSSLTSATQTAKQIVQVGRWVVAG